MIIQIEELQLSPDSERSETFEALILPCWVSADLENITKILRMVISEGHPI